MRLLMSLAVAAFTAFGAAQAEEAAFSVKRSGEGAPVLFIPGLASGGAVWDGTVAALNGVEAHVVTLAGFAGEPPVEGPFIETRIDALAAYLEKNDLKDVVIVGHSLGGVMAMKLAMAEPERIGRIVIVDSAPFLAQFFGAADEAGAKVIGERMRAQIMGATDEAYAAQQAGFAKTQTADAAAQENILDWSLASDRATVGQAMYELLADDLRDDIAGLAQPALVLYAWREGAPYAKGQADAAYAAQYAAAPNVALKRIDGSAHFIMYDRPEALLEAIKAVVEE